MIDQIQLTLIEKKLIHQVARIQVESLMEIYANGHPEIEDFLREYGEAYDCREMDAILEIDNLMNTYAGVKLNPQLILKTNNVFLAAAMFILSHDNWIPAGRYTNARRNLCKKLLKVIEFNNKLKHNQN